MQPEGTQARLARRYGMACRFTGEVRRRRVDWLTGEASSPLRYGRSIGPQAGRWIHEWVDWLTGEGPQTGRLAHRRVDGPTSGSIGSRAGRWTHEWAYRLVCGPILITTHTHA